MFVSSLKRIRFADYAPFRSRRNGGRFGISPPVGDAVGIEALLEAAHELGAVIFDSEARRLWQQLTQRIKGDGSLLAGLGDDGGDVKAGVRVDESEQVAAQSIAPAHHSIAGEHFKRLILEAFGLAGDGFVVASGTQSGGGMAHFVWVASDEAADGGDVGQRDVLLPAPGSQQDPQFGFAAVGELLSQLADFPNQHRCCDCRRRLGAQDLAVRAAGASSAWRTVSSDKAFCD
ncbi:hypothetical protein [Candidatus Spongiihabitans sp.]|uniref:hypothetical protein n=1 Tax=Candidatus Spongiihabitans sp. TaxID=3101308 RepID=UPI003C7040B2